MTDFKSKIATFRKEKLPTVNKFAEFLIYVGAVVMLGTALARVATEVFPSAAVDGSKIMKAVFAGLSLAVFGLFFKMAMKPLEESPKQVISDALYKNIKQQCLIERPTF